MYIKEIKINGFKSFADNTILELNKNFTGVVGPNGSGKSNIVDALKWVMGEQSVKTLRGSNGMTDVIFSGSQSRDEARSAKVSIVLDNTDKSIPLDYSEIEIKRVVYKSGENEYFINNEKVRLKDITDLFVDTFSSKESLSIIPQGKISEIVNGKPEEKRVVIEEAASVIKYKKRKEDSLRKLAKTNENVERVNMIINELSLQLNPLEQQAKKARIYKEAKEKLENLEVSMLANDISALNEEYTLIKNEKETIENKLIDTVAVDSKEKIDLESKKIKRSKLDEEITNSQSKYLEITEKLGTLKNDKELLIERSKYDKDSDEITNNLRVLKENKLSLDSEKNALKLKIDNEIEEFNKEKEKLNALTLEMNSLNVRLNNYNREIDEIEKDKLSLENRKDILEMNIESMSKVPYSVKAVLTNPSLSGINNTISNLVEVSSEYAQAIETALGAAANFIVCETSSDAKEAIEYLKRNNKGRCTFFPLSEIKPKGIDGETLNLVKTEIGFIKIASDLVNYDKKYYNIITNQLGNIIVADNIDNALKISKKISSKYRVVTLEGEILHVGGSLTGGSKNNTSVLSDRLELDNLSSKIKLDEIKYEEISAKLKEALDGKEILTSKIYDINVNIVSKNEVNTTNRNRLNEIDTKLNEITNEINALSTGKKDSEIDKITNEYYKVLEDKNALEINIKNLEKTRKELVEEINDLETTINKVNSENKELETKLNNLNIKEARLSVNLDNLLNRLNEEYNMTYEKARNNYELSMDINEARNIISEAKKAIKSLGEVNVGSIEEYDRISKRYNFLNNQKEDLLKAQEDLLSIIKEMDDVMIDKFATTFKKVNIEFSKVFKNLFGGGEAHLELTDPTNILETGVEIKAYPPGKKPNALSLLSGGEMTLTAISLLFAIMNLKNVPFVILDEVESALDEINVEKFGKYIKSYKGKTQLLVITHKKKTMEFLDLLYGITMQESGVSKLVSVKLEEIK